MDLRSVVVWICLILFVGSAGLISSAIFPNNTAIVIASVLLSGSFCLYLAILTEFIIQDISEAVKGKNLEVQTSALTSLIGKTLYRVISEETKKDEPVKEG